MKKLLSVCLGAVLAFSGTICAFAQTNTTDFNVKIVHTNDIHARVEESSSSSIIGMPKLKTLIDDYTSGSDIDLVLDSGDLYHGQSIATLVQGESVAQLVKACGYDAMTAGNHDWNYGKEQLKNLAEISDCPVLAGNVVTADGKSYFDQNYYTAESTKNGSELKVGVFGMIDPKIYKSTAPSNVEGLTFSDMKTYADKAVTELKDSGCDVVICLTHCYDPVSLAESINGVDLWLAGHEHIDLDTTVTTPDGSKSKVIENGYYLYEAGLIELDCTVDNNGEVENIEYTASKADYTTAGQLTANADVSSLLEKIKADESVTLNKVVGSSPADLDGVWEHLRIDETNLGRAVTDAYLLETGADIAFENAGGIRASVSKGDVTYGNIIGISPFGNYIVTKELTGSQIIETLESSLTIQKNCIAAYESGIYDAWPKNSGSCLQVGGMTVEYDLSKPEGQRIVSAKVGNELIQNNKLYTVATNNYNAISSNFPQLMNAPEKGEFCACDEALIQYFKQNSDKILASVTTARMIKYTEPVTTQPQTTQPATTETTTATAVPTAKPDATSATGSAATTDTAKGNDAVQTGAVQTTAAVLIVVMLAAAAGYYVFRKRTNK